MHAPVARIRGARVVTFCSVACADRSATPAPVLASGSEVGVAQVAPAPAEKPAKAAKAAKAKPAPRNTPVPAPAPALPPTPTTTPTTSTSTSTPAAATSSGSMALHPEATSRRRGRGALFAVLAVLLAGGIVVLALEVFPGLAEEGAPERPTPAKPRETAAAVKEGAATAPDAPDGRRDPKALHVAATAELRALQKSTSPRVRRLAAQALARTGEPAALELLRSMLTEEPSQLSKIQIAYALARAGDTRAVEDLRALLGAERRDVRLDAARSLVQLGDDSGARALRAMLDVDTHRIGAAGLLARLNDAEGLKVLRAEATSKQAGAEARMRAAVALGRAGDASVKGQLVEILADKRYNVGAADALAALGDPAAVEPLTAQLALSAVRVPAALWLRRMKKDVDLEPLALAVESGDEASRVSAAEALLVLTGPDAMAERD